MHASPCAFHPHHGKERAAIDLLLTLLGTEKPMTARDVTGFLCILLAREFANFLHIYGGRIVAERTFRGFLFLSRRILSRILSPDFFSSFSWEKVPRKILQEIPDKILQMVYNKNPQQFSAEGPGQHLITPNTWKKNSKIQCRIVCYCPL